MFIFFSFLYLRLFHLQQTVEQWRIVFIITSCICLSGSFVFWFWSSGELQSWARKSEEGIHSKSYIVDSASNGYTNEGAEMETQITKH